MAQSTYKVKVLVNRKNQLLLVHEMVHTPWGDHKDRALKDKLMGDSYHLYVKKVKVERPMEIYEYKLENLI